MVVTKKTKKKQADFFLIIGNVDCNTNGRMGPGPLDHNIPLVCASSSRHVSLYKITTRAYVCIWLHFECALRTNGGG